MNKEESSSFVSEIEDLNNLIQVALKNKDKDYVNEMLVNALKEGGLVVPHLKDKAILNSLHLTKQLFTRNIELSPTELKKTHLGIRKKIILNYLAKLSGTIFAISSLLLLSFSFLNNLVVQSLSGKVHTDSSNDETNILYAFIVFVIIASWYISDYLYQKFICPKELKSNFKTSGFFFMLYTLIALPFVAWLLPSYQSLLERLIISHDGVLTIYVFLAAIFGMGGAGPLILPMFFLVTYKTFRRLF